MLKILTVKQLEEGDRFVFVVSMLVDFEVFF